MLPWTTEGHLVVDGLRPSQGVIMKPGKKRGAALQKPDRSRRYTLVEAVSLLKELAFANFDESVDVAVRLGVDP